MDQMGNTAAEVNYYALFMEWNQEEIENYEVGLVGAGLGGGFNHNSELNGMKCEEVIMDPMMKLEMRSQQQSLTKARFGRT